MEDEQMKQPAGVEGLNVMDMTQDELEAAEAKKHKKAKPPKKAMGKGLLWGMLGVVMTVLVLGGGLMAGMALQKMENKDKIDEDGLSGAEGGLIEGGGGGVLVKNVAKVPQDDKLSLAFLKMHNERENSCYSPLSVRYALEMLSVGADGETKAQIDELLGGVKATRYENVADHLSVANSLWITEAYSGKLQKSYEDILRSEFGAVVKVDSLQSAANINAWIGENTMGLLKDPLTDADVQGLNAALVNVLAIDMNWVNEFDKVSTFGGFFDFDNLDIDENTDVDQDQYKYTTMQRYGGKDIYYNLAADATLLAQDLEDYNGTQLQFVAIMPKDLQKYVEKVEITDINRLLAGMRVAERQNDTYEFSFHAYIPKFGIEGGIVDLIGDLKTLGVIDAFDSEKADLKKMLDMDGFAIDSATHKTKFDFSEEGIKAAAVTVVGGKGSGGGPGPIPSSSHIVVSINKPFMYLVRDKRTGEIWFSGTVYDPNHWADDKVNYGVRW